ncbi:MAG: sigma 54-interacting transcriptional regulator [Deltaproteobacteria bacterium]|nr:sigma 54-interacting transcriptional regulator [Deltaproteobacteria bacterium]
MLVVRASRLSVEQGPDRGKELALEGRPVVVGTDPTCDLVLTDPAVSARHLSVEPRREGFLLKDLGSTNGTFVDGYRAEALYLPSGAQLELGGTTLRFLTLAEELELPLSKRTRLGGLLGHGEAMRQVFAILERVAPTEATVLLEGESGTGKELAARALHELSPRKTGPFIALDCGAIPPALIESELFGHAKGAFTGAAHAKAGPFEEAEGGTVFLDELGELPLELQPKLLRVLESRTVRRVGESQVRAIDARFVAATNRNLSQEVEAGRFRQDLFFRLSVIRVRLPALRERREEIPRLVAHFLAQLGHDPAQPIPSSMMELLSAHAWPGNVRELRNVVERLALLPGMTPQYYLDGEGRPCPPAGEVVVPLDVPFHEGKRVWTERFEREYLAALLSRCGGNISELARVSGLSRQSCHRLLDRYGLT